MFSPKEKVLKIIMLDENQTDIVLMKPLFAECAQCLRLPWILCRSVGSILILKHSFVIIKKIGNGIRFFLKWVISIALAIQRNCRNLWD